MNRRHARHNGEYCRCAHASARKLMWAATKSPLWCLACEQSVPLERLRLSSELEERILAWARRYENVYGLWLDSGEYEAWASCQLHVISSPLNRTGLALTRTLRRRWDVYYWFDSDPDDVDVSAVSAETCPACHSPLFEAAHWKMPLAVCRKCRLVVPSVGAISTAKA